MANLLTGLRLLLALPVAAAIAVEGLLPAPMLAAMILAAIATDYLDGRIARASGTASDGGQLFDHATDFIFVGGGLTGAAVAGAGAVAASGSGHRRIHAICAGLTLAASAQVTTHELSWPLERNLLFRAAVLIAVARLLEIGDLQPILYRAPSWFALFSF